MCVCVRKSVFVHEEEWKWRGGAEEDRCGVFVQESPYHTCCDTPLTLYTARPTNTHINMSVYVGTHMHLPFTVRSDRTRT